MAKWDFCSFHMWKPGHNLSYKIWTVHISDMKIWMKQFYMKYMFSQSLCLSRSHVWMWEMDYKVRWAGKLMLLNCGVGEGSWESPGWLGEIQPVHPKGHQSWIFLQGLRLRVKLQYFGHLMWRTDALERILMLGKVQGRRRRDNTGWEDWMASLNQWIWVWVNSVSWWPTGRPGMVQFMWTQRFEHDWATKRNWTWPYPSKQESASPSVSLSHKESFPQASYFIHQRVERMKIIITEI